MVGCRFQIFKTKEVIKVATYRELLLLPNIYVPYIEDMPEYNKQIYVLDYDIENTLKLIRQKGLTIEPETITKLDGSVVNLYVDEYEAKKFTDTIIKARSLSVGDVVTIKQFHRLPLTVVDITKDRNIQLEHKMNNLTITMTTKEDRCNRIPDDVKVSHYIQEEIVTPVAKIFIDCDMYSTEQSLLDDSTVVKTIYRDYKVYFLNPIGNQHELAKVLGISAIYGNKYTLTQRSVHNVDLDLIYSDDLNFLRYTPRMIYLEFYNNIGMPEVIYRDNIDLEFSEVSNKKLLTSTGFKIILRDTIIKDLNYDKIRDFFTNNQLGNYIEDLPYYIKILKR